MILRLNINLNCRCTLLTRLVDKVHRNCVVTNLATIKNFYELITWDEALFLILAYFYTDAEIHIFRICNVHKLSYHVYLCLKDFLCWLSKFQICQLTLKFSGQIRFILNFYDFGLVCIFYFRSFADSFIRIWFINHFDVETLVKFDALKTG